MASNPNPASVSRDPMRAPAHGSYPRARSETENSIERASRAVVAGPSVDVDGARAGAGAGLVRTMAVASLADEEVDVAEQLLVALLPPRTAAAGRGGAGNIAAGSNERTRSSMLVVAESGLQKVVRVGEVASSASMSEKDRMPPGARTRWSSRRVSAYSSFSFSVSSVPCG